MLYHFNGTFCVRAGYLNNSNIYICNLLTCQVGSHIDMRGENNILWDRYIIDIALSDAMSQPIV